MLALGLWGSEPLSQSPCTEGKRQRFWTPLVANVVPNSVANPGTALGVRIT